MFLEHKLLLHLREGDKNGIVSNENLTMFRIDVIMVDATLENGN